MASDTRNPAKNGAVLLSLGAAVALGVCFYNYFAPVSLLAPDSSITGSPGAILVIVSTAILLVFAMLLRRPLAGGLRVFLIASALLDIAGTAFAAWLLNSKLLVGIMGLCLIGWLLLLRRQPAMAAA
jgi:hypothetical protein